MYSFSRTILVWYYDVPISPTTFLLSSWRITASVLVCASTPTEILLCNNISIRWLFPSSLCYSFSEGSEATQQLNCLRVIVRPECTPIENWYTILARGQQSHPVYLAIRFRTITRESGAVDFFYKTHWTDIFFVLKVIPKIISSVR